MVKIIFIKMALDFKNVSEVESGHVSVSEVEGRHTRYQL